MENYRIMYGLPNEDESIKLTLRPNIIMVGTTEGMDKKEVNEIRQAVLKVIKKRKDMIWYMAEEINGNT